MPARELLRRAPAVARGQRAQEARQLPRRPPLDEDGHVQPGGQAAVDRGPHHINADARLGDGDAHVLKVRRGGAAGVELHEALKPILQLKL